MGKLDNLFAKNLNASKLKTLLNLSISRLAVLRNQRHARCNLARADIVQILNLGHHDRALIRVEQVIKEQNMLDVFIMIEGYCNLLAERINLLKQEKVCPEELKEAVSGLLYASTRCGEFPELIEMRAIFIARFGKEFAGRAIELRNNCGVNPRIIQKLSTRQPMLENRLKALKEIAAENNIILKFEQDYSIATEENLRKEQNKPQFKPEVSENSSGPKAGDAVHNFTDNTENIEEVTDSIKVRRKYKDVADAAQAAFESAAYAAAAARMAVELSKSENHDRDDQNNHSSGRRRGRDEMDTIKSEVQPIKDQRRSALVSSYDSESEDEEIQREILPKPEDAGSRKIGMTSDKSDDESGEGGYEVPLSKTNTSMGLNPEPNFAKDEDTEILELETEKNVPTRSGAGVKTDSWFDNFAPKLKKESKVQTPQHLEEKRPVSVRTRFRAWRHNQTRA